MNNKKIFNSFLYLSLSLCMLNFSCSKKNPIGSGNNYGIVEGIVKIDPSPYSIGIFGESTPSVTVGLLGESSTMDWIRGNFYEVGNTGVYQASFSLGSYDGNKNPYLGTSKGVIPGTYSIRFYDGFFDKNVGERIDLEEKVVSTIGDTPIEVTAGKTTHIGVVTLTP